MNPASLSISRSDRSQIAPAIQSDKGNLRLMASAGTIYYTLDGTDPRLPGGALSPKATAYAQPIPRAAGQVLKARAVQGEPGTLEWSALLETD